MTITGSFRDYDNRLITVTIYSGVGDTYPIDDILGSTVSGNTVHFCFSGKNPVKITRSTEDLFSPIISSRCQIRLVSDIWCGDLLYTSGIGDIIVSVTRKPTSNDNSTSELMFLGYVQPMTFSQDINKKSNDIDINCVDLLSALESKKLSTGTTYEAAVSNAQYHTFKQFFSLMGLYGETFTFPGTEYTTETYIDTVQQDKINLLLSDNLWLGDSVDSETSMYDMLVEFCKYMNCRLVSVNGKDFFFIDNSNTTSAVYFIQLSNTEAGEQTFSYMGSLPTTDIANEQVNVDETYNRIGVKCDLETVDDVVTSPLEESSLKSPYTNKQLFMREYMCDVTNSTKLSRYHDFCHLVTENNFTNVEYEGCKYVDWYMRYLENSLWTCSNNINDDDLISDEPYITSGNYTWQNRMTYDLGYTHTYIGTTQDEGTYYKRGRYNNKIGGAYFAAIGKSEDYTRTDNSIKGYVNTTNYLVVPVKGMWYDENSENTAISEYASLLEEYNTTPMLSYNNPTIMNLSPSDTNTTNYIVISGSMRLVPVYQRNNTDGRIQGLMYMLDYDWLKDDLEDDLSDGDVYPARFAQGPNGDRLYYNRFFELQTPNTQITDYNITSTAPDGINAPNTRTLQMIPPIDNSGLYQFQYQYNMITNTLGTTYDNLTHIPVLCCRMYVVGANGATKYVSQDPETFSFSWSDDSSSTFAISINPAIDDYIIGPEHTIMNTVTSSMNINASGIAIPVTNSDAIAGAVHFEILGPYNSVYDDTTKKTHSRWTQFWRGEPPAEFSSIPRSILNRISNIFINKFEVKVYSNNAKNATNNESDLLYYSEDNLNYTNTKDDISFKICTALTSTEAKELNVSTGISFNNPTTSTNNLYNPQTKPEETYVETMWNLYNTPKKEITYQASINTTDISALYRTVFSCDLMEDLNVSDFSTIVLGDELDLKSNRMNITLREI